MVEYFTDEYYQTIAKRLNDDDEFQEKASNLSTSLVQVAKDKDKAVKFTIDDGQVTAQEVGPDEEAEFRLIASYDDWTKVVKGEEKVDKLVMMGKMKVEGSMAKLLQYRDQLEYLTKVGQDIGPET